HRRESRKEDRAHVFFDDVKESTGPVELMWMDGRENFPRAVAGIMSTALISPCEILPDDSKVHAFWPPPDMPLVDRQLDSEKLLALFHRFAALGRMDVRRLDEHGKASS